MQTIANQLPDAFDNKKIVKSHIATANIPAKIDVSIGQSNNVATNKSKTHFKMKDLFVQKIRLPEREK